MKEAAMHVTYLLYQGVEPVDLAAIGVISMAKRVIPSLSYETVAATADAVELANGLRVLPTRTFEEIESVDLLLVPGGPGWRKASTDPLIQSFIKRVAPEATVLSVCTGAMILAEVGLLEGRMATTKVEVVPPEVSPMTEMRERFPSVRAEPALIVDTGAVITGGGVTLCIDATLYMLERRFGSEAANEVARIMEYAAAWRANRARMGVVDARQLTGASE
jgi:transcriptional regulator GlxA family with amidase domain